VTDEHPETDESNAASMTRPTSSPHVRVELPARGRDGVALITIDRPEALNALTFAIVGAIADALEALDADPACRAVVLTGAGERAFAAGADIKELAEQTATGLSRDDPFVPWDRIRAVGIPIVAAVRGFALGGGCELAMTCDLLIAGDDARFGQPEIKLGVMPGAGGTQRLTRAVGKARAMELILTGRSMDAAEAQAAGLVTRVVPAAETLDAALDVAATIAGMSPVAVAAAKRSVLRADELALAAGLDFERREFYLLFASEDQREGMAAFTEKRAPAWKGR
jgi:enoyl-CoA hydratase